MMRRARLAGLAAAAALVAAPAAAIDPSPSYLDPQAGEGCWVRFFDGKDFAQPLGRLGPTVYINSLKSPGLIGNMDIPEFFARASSLVVGPEARLVAYAEPAFRKEIFTLEPDHKAADLEAMRFHERVASLKIVCLR